MIKHLINLFQAKLESLQYNATLAITGAIRDSSTEKIHEGLDLESLNQNVDTEK